MLLLMHIIPLSSFSPCIQQNIDGRLDRRMRDVMLVSGIGRMWKPHEHQGFCVSLLIYSVQSLKSDLSSYVTWPNAEWQNILWILILLFTGWSVSCHADLMQLSCFRQKPSCVPQLCCFMRLHAVMNRAWTVLSILTNKTMSKRVERCLFEFVSKL